MKHGPTTPRRASKSAAARTTTWARRVQRWLHNGTCEDRYLATATDHADLERRMRKLERASRGPAFVTFNH